MTETPATGPDPEPASTGSAAGQPAGPAEAGPAEAGPAEAGQPAVFARRLDGELPALPDWATVEPG